MQGQVRGDPSSSGEDRGNPFAPTSDPPPLSSEISRSAGTDRQGAWSVTRFSEVFHRRIVAPMMGQTVATTSAAGEEHVATTTSTWQSPTTTTPAQTPLMSPEVRQAMASWTSQPSLLARPAAPVQGHRDDSSSASLSQEQILEEVRRQVQCASFF